ncbi:hypothetical protein BTJ39_07955 [Izhakiella australiensis]|uniref:Virulence effector protein n=1 Tax=Izhakiella australiensis TaxID=1926881 RepID=A0A1S8YN43_9GAMM|nr:SrfA family protein [Izhakiella australiensis]OON40342.1 hypothetical protein BTJ39_07955 [Izhakiella australiensis]
MANTFLRSGNLDSVLALGENGQPVWHSALQIRETLRLRQQQALADLFAIPQPNEAGNRLDWYAPFSGKVIAWNSASESVRAQALGKLEQSETALREMSNAALAAGKPGQKLFGALLSKALQFPDQNCVFLVGGKPVIAFWGFNALNKKSAEGLDLLRSSARDAPPASLAKEPAPQAAPAVTAKSFTAPTAPLLETAPQNEPVAQPQTPASAPVSAPTPAPVVAPPPAADIPADDEPAAVYQRPMPTKPAAAIVTPSQPASQPQPPFAAPSVAKATPGASLRRYGWVLPGVALVALLGFQLRGCMSTEKATPTASQAPAPVAPKTEAPKPQPPQPATSDVAAQPPAAQTTPPLPLNAASVAQGSQPAPAANPPATSTPTEPAPGEQQPPATPVPVAKDDLVLPENAVRLGSTRFLNGSWRAILDIKTPITGKPPSLRYQLTNGKGIARLLQGDGTSCRVEVFAGLMKSGNLVINSRTKAKCSDGARYAIPELTCTQGATGPAQCSARYDENTAYPITMKREGK